MTLVRCSLLLAMVLAPSAAGAQTTPWGDPDLQGVWTNQTPVPLERPAPLGSKAVFTKEEAEQFERTSLPRLLSNLAPGVPTSGELNEIWLETQSGKVPPGRRTSLVAGLLLAGAVVVVTTYYVAPHRLPPFARDLLSMVLGG